MPRAASTESRLAASRQTGAIRARRKMIRMSRSTARIAAPTRSRLERVSVVRVDEIALSPANPVCARLSPVCWSRDGSLAWRRWRAAMPPAPSLAAVLGQLVRGAGAVSTDQDLPLKRLRVQLREREVEDRLVV